jgi:hypothetical protein
MAYRSPANAPSHSGHRPKRFVMFGFVHLQAQSYPTAKSPPHAVPLVAGASKPTKQMLLDALRLGTEAGHWLCDPAGAKGSPYRNRRAGA